MHLSIQDFLAILGPILTLMGFMWHHSNSRFQNIDRKFEKMEEKIENLRADIKGVEEKLGADIKRLEEKLGADIKRLEEKVDAVRDRVSRIEGQLVPAKVFSFEEAIPKPAARLNPSKVAQAL